MRIPASLLARHSASLCSLGFGQGGKPVLLRAAVSADAPPSADDGPLSEQRRLDIDLVKPGEIAHVIRSFHVNGQHDSKRRRSGFLGSKLFSLLPTVFNKSPFGSRAGCPPSDSRRRKLGGSLVKSVIFSTKLHRFF